MEQQALGLVEVIGYTAAIEAADVAVKAANVTLVGYELTRGLGMVTIKVLGRVAAVNAAVAAAAAAASRINKVVSTRVIARPDPQIGPLVSPPSTMAFVAATRQPSRSSAPSSRPRPRDARARHRTTRTARTGRRTTSAAGRAAERPHGGIAPRGLPGHARAVGPEPHPHRLRASGLTTSRTPKRRRNE